MKQCNKVNGFENQVSMKLIINVLLLLFSIFSIAQTKTPTEQEAREYFEMEHETISTSTYFEEDGELFDFYSRKNPGDILITGTEFVKVLGPKLLTIYECSMIFFDNRKQPEAEIELIHKTIMANYNSGFTFQELAEKYSDPLSYSAEAIIDIEGLPDSPLKSGLEQHSPKQMFFVKASEFISYLIIINNLPVKRKGIIVQHAVYE